MAYIVRQAVRQFADAHSGVGRQLRHAHLRGCWHRCYASEDECKDFLHILIIAASGSFTVTLDDGKCKRSFFLNRPYQGLYVKPGMWRDLVDFSSGAVCMVLASDVYKPEDYIRDYDSFLKFRNDE